MSKKYIKPVEGPYVAVPHEVLNSPAFLALSYSAQSLLFTFYSYVRSPTSNGNLSAAIKNLRHRGWGSEATLAKALKELVAVGLIRETRNTHGVQEGHRMCKLYRLTDRDCYGNPALFVEPEKASHEYREFESLSEAKAAIRKAVPYTPKKKATTGGQKKINASDSEASSSKSEVIPFRICSYPRLLTSESEVMKLPQPP